MKAPGPKLVYAETVQDLKMQILVKHRDMQDHLPEWRGTNWWTAYIVACTSGPAYPFLDAAICPDSYCSELGAPSGFTYFKKDAEHITAGWDYMHEGWNNLGEYSLEQFYSELGSGLRPKIIIDAHRVVSEIRDELACQT